MSSKAAKRRKRLGRKACISLAAAPEGFNGDHGTGTKSFMSGTVLVPIKGDPNRRAYRQRVDVWRRLNLTMRQEQAARAIRDAYSAVEALSSGGPLKERVQSSPKPDATIAVQVEAQSRLAHVMRGVPQGQRDIVEHVLWHNKPFRALKNRPRCASLFRIALDAVADHMCY